MPKFRILKTATFDEGYEKLDASERGRIDAILDSLAEAGDVTGKPLSGLSFFREKKFDGKRLYYLVYQEVLVILVLAISDKKAQQATINEVLLHLASYKIYIYDAIKKLS